jgi:hypothetical protein
LCHAAPRFRDFPPGHKLRRNTEKTRGSELAPCSYEATWILMSERSVAVK